MKKTALEWLIENCHIVPKNELNKRELIQQAKEMEKEQIIDAHLDGQCFTTTMTEFNYAEQYYRETFKNN